MKFEKMHEDMNMALKTGDKLTRLVLGDIIGTIKTAATSGKTKVDITDDFVDDVLIKYKKGIEDQIASCGDLPKYMELKEQCRRKLEIVERYVPKVITDKNEIAQMITQWAEKMGVSYNDKKTIMPMCKKAHMDMKIVAQVLNELVKNE